MKFQSNSIFNGTITANSVADAGTNTDKFLVLNSSGVVTYRTAAELYADLGVGSSSAAYTSTLKHTVKAGEAINKGQAVYVSSADGTNMIVTKASNTAESTSSKTIGLLETTLANNGIGNVITEGLLAGLDTTGATNAGDPVWLGTGGNLIYGLINKPYAPAHLVFIGIVTRINANNGEIFVKVQNGFELKEIHDVDLITTTPVNGHILGYNGTIWVNKTIAGWLGFTPVTNARTLTINGTAYDLSADRSWTISSMIYPGAGIAVSTGTAWGTSITDNSTNWNTAYTNRITSLTVTGSSGAATLVSNVLNIPTYTLAGLGGVATSRTLTINGTAYDLSADRSWTIDSTSASTRTIQKFTATSGQTTFTITGGYAVGMVDVYMNGVKLDNATDFTASNGTTVVLAAGALTNSVIEVYKFGSQFIPNNALRQATAFTATAGQTSFTVTYSVGLVDVFYNGAKLAASEYTAISGTAIVLGTACQLNDIVEVVAYSYTVGSFTGIGGSGTTNYHPKFSSSSAITTSGIYEGASGFISIGNTNTTYNLDVTGTGRFTGALTTGGGVNIGATSFTSPSGADTILGVYGGQDCSLILQDAVQLWELYVNDDFYINRGSTNVLTALRSNGNVGIGTSSPTNLLHVSKDLTGEAIANISNTSSTGFGLAINSGGGTRYALAISSYDFNPIARFLANGDVYLNATSSINGSKFYVQGTSTTAAEFYTTPSATAGLLVEKGTNDNTTSQVFIRFLHNSASVGAGQINGNGASSAAFGSYSDERLKENITNLPSQLSNILALRPVEFDYIESEGSGHQIGFIAQEMEKVYPDVVGKREDEMLTITGWNKTEARLVKAIQEMNTKIIELEKLVATK